MSDVKCLWVDLCCLTLRRFQCTYASCWQYCLWRDCARAWPGGVSGTVSDVHILFVPDVAINFASWIVWCCHACVLNSKPFVAVQLSSTRTQGGTGFLYECRPEISCWKAVSKQMLWNLECAELDKAAPCFISMKAISIERSSKFLDVALSWCCLLVPSVSYLHCYISELHDYLFTILGVS